MKLYVAVFMLVAFALALHGELLDTAARIFNDSGLSDAEVHARVSALSDYALTPPRGEVLEFTHALNDTLDAPFYVVVPEGYSNDRDWPLLVWLHGGVGTREFYPDNIERLRSREDYMLTADSLQQYIHLYPMARYDCQWWAPIGRDNILWQIRFVKDRFRVDDNRVYVSGASDGGSGSYNLGLVRPDDFAAIMPHIGMVSVASYVTQIPVYPVNLRNRPLRAVNNEYDRLYPASEVNKHITAMRNAGVAINYTTYGFGHDMNYWRDDFVTQNRFMELRQRDLFQSALTWECDDRDLGSGVDWLAIAALDTTLAAKDWHVEVQDSLYDRRISFGFYPARDWAGSGILVDSLASGDTAARGAGLMAGDIIIGMNAAEIVDMGDMDSLKAYCKRGDKFTLFVERDDEHLVLEGAFPPPTSYGAFYYDEHKSGRVEASYEDNLFDLKTSRVAAVTIKLHPGMVDFDRTLRVNVNGHQVWEGHVAFDRRYMQRDFEENLDRKALWASEVTVEIRPEYR